MRQTFFSIHQEWILGEEIRMKERNKEKKKLEKVEGLQEVQHYIKKGLGGNLISQHNQWKVNMRKQGVEAA